MGIEAFLTHVVLQRLRPRATRNTAAFAQMNQPPTLERLFVVSVESGLVYTALFVRSYPLSTDMIADSIAS